MAKKTKRRMNRRETRKKYNHKKHTKKHMKVKKSRSKRGGGEICIRYSPDGKTVMKYRHYPSILGKCPPMQNCIYDYKDDNGKYVLASQVAKDHPRGPYSGRCMTKIEQLRGKKNN